MSLKQRSIFITAVSFLSLVTILYVIFSTVLMREFARIEHMNMHSNVERVQRALENTTKQLVAKTVDWAQWDDTYTFIDDGNQKYKDSILNYETLSALGMRHVLFFKQDRSFFQGWEIDYEKEEIRSVTVGDITPIAGSAQLLGHSDADSRKQGLVHLGDTVLIVASVPIVDSKRVHPTKGSLVFTQAITKEFVEELASQTRLTLLAYSLQVSTLGLEEQQTLSQLSAGNPITVKSVNQDTILGYGLESDLLQRPVLLFKVTRSRDLYKQGLEARNLVVSLVGMAGLAFSLIAVLLLHKGVVGPVADLGQRVTQIAVSGDSSERLKVGPRDEIGKLSIDINSMLAALDSAKRQVENARDEAQAANEAKSAFIAKVSHELRTPLHGILGTFRIVLRANVPGEVQEYLRKAQDAANGLLGIINDILDFSKFASHSIVLENVLCTFRHVVRDVLSLVGPKVYEKPGLELTAFLDPKLPETFRGDPLRINQLLVNLVGNAIKFTNKGKVSLEVMASPDGRSIVWRVSDTGCGIPAERVDTIFEPFTQADNSATRRYSGTGLGLTITKQLVEAMGGTIRVESQERIGSTFTIEMPLRAFDSSTSVNTIPHQPRTTDSRKVVVVAEEGHFGEFLERSLSAAGASARREILRGGTLTVKPDELVFFDGSLLELSRYDSALIALVREHPREKILVIIPPGDLNTRLSLKSRKIDNVLIKPVSSADIARALLGQSEQSVVGSDHYEAGEALRKLGLRVLIAEDVPLNQLVLKQMLEDSGFTVKAVEDGEALLESLQPTLRARAQGQPGEFDLVITDIQMPKMDGVEATAAIRTMEQTLGGGSVCPCPIFALSGNAFVEEHTRLYSAGIDAVITKPVDPNDLWQNIKVKVKEGRIAVRDPEILKRSGGTPDVDVERLLQQATLAVDAILASNKNTLEQIQRVYRTYLEDLSYQAPAEVDDAEMKRLFFSYAPLFEQISYRREIITSVMELFLRDHERLLETLAKAQGSHQKEELRKAVHSLKGFLAQAGCRLGEKVAEIAERESHTDFHRASALAAQLAPVTRAFAQVVETFMAEQSKTAGFVAG